MPQSKLSFSPAPQWLQNILLKEFSLREVKGDYQKLSDRILQGAIDDALKRPTDVSRPLRQSEYDALMGSPITLLRLIKLRAQVSVEQEDIAISPQVLALLERYRLPGRVAQGELLAAGSGGVDAGEPLRSDNGQWSLCFIPQEGGGWQFHLKLLVEDEVDALAQSPTPLIFAVLDGTGRVLLSGGLDAYGELRGPWTLAEAPSTLLNAGSQRGCAWSVERI